MRELDYDPHNASRWIHAPPFPLRFVFLLAPLSRHPGVRRVVIGRNAAEPGRRLWRPGGRNRSGAAAAILCVTGRAGPTPVVDRDSFRGTEPTARAGPAGALSREQSAGPSARLMGGRCRGATGRFPVSAPGPELSAARRLTEPRGLPGVGAGGAEEPGPARPGGLRLHLRYRAGAGAVFLSKLTLNGILTFVDSRSAISCGAGPA